MRPAPAIIRGPIAQRTERLSWVSSGLPRPVIAEHGVEHGQELAHGGGQGDLPRMPGGAEALIERADAWVVADGGESGHVQDAPD